MGRKVHFLFERIVLVILICPRSSGVEHSLGKGEAIGSIPIVGTILLVARVELIAALAKTGLLGLNVSGL